MPWKLSDNGNLPFRSGQPLCMACAVSGGCVTAPRCLHGELEPWAGRARYFCHQGNQWQHGEAPEGWNLEGQLLPFLPGQRGPEHSTVLAAWGSPLGARFAALQTHFTPWCHSYHPQPRRGDKCLS